VIPNNILSLLPVATGILIISNTLLVTDITRAEKRERERRPTGVIVEAILDGEAVTRTANDFEFLCIYTPAESGTNPD